MISLPAILALIPFYGLGAFPTGYLIAKAQGVDITSVGSGNVGATNVARVIGKKAGLMTLGLDVFKGFLGVSVASWLYSDDWFTVLAGVSLVSGHCFSLPPWLKGGKGVATALGVTLALNWPAALVAVGIFAAVFFLSRIVSLSSVTAALSAPIGAFFLASSEDISMGLVCVGLLVTYRHKENLKRLSEGREPKFTFGKPKAEES